MQNDFSITVYPRSAVVLPLLIGSPSANWSTSPGETLPYDDITANDETTTPLSVATASDTVFTGASITSSPIVLGNWDLSAWPENPDVEVYSITAPRMWGRYSTSFLSNALRFSYVMYQFQREPQPPLGNYWRELTGPRSSWVTSDGSTFATGAAQTFTQREFTRNAAVQARDASYFSSRGFIAQLGIGVQAFCTNHKTPPPTAQSGTIRAGFNVNPSDLTADPTSGWGSDGITIRFVPAASRRRGSML